MPDQGTPGLTLATLSGERADVAIRPGAAHLLGRGEECHTSLLDARVSRRHASLEFRDGCWWLRDLGSSHGTSVDGRPVAPDAPVPLRSGIVVSIGPWRWRAEVEGQEAGAQRVAFERPPPGAGPDTYATRPTIFLRLRAEDAAARELSWQDFCTRYAPVIAGFARNAGLRSQDADDVMQEVLLGFFQASPRFTYDPARGRFRGYLKRCVLNAMRRRRGLPSADLDAVEPAAEDPELEASWERMWEAQALERAMAEVQSRLEARTFEAFDLYTRRDVPAEAVAERLGISVNSVHQAKARVSRLVREALEAIREQEG